MITTRYWTSRRASKVSKSITERKIDERPIMSDNAARIVGVDARKNATPRGWTEAEDESLKWTVNMFGATKWTMLASRMKETHGVDRTGKQCRERWMNHVNPSIKKGEWTHEEDEHLLRQYEVLGSRWSEIARSMNTGRTDGDVKNHFNSSLKKRVVVNEVKTPPRRRQKREELDLGYPLEFSVDSIVHESKTTEKMLEDLGFGELGDFDSLESILRMKEQPHENLVRQPLDVQLERVVKPRFLKFEQLFDEPKRPGGFYMREWSGVIAREGVPGRCYKVELTGGDKTNQIRVMKKINALLKAEDEDLSDTSGENALGAEPGSVELEFEEDVVLTLPVV